MSAINSSKRRQLVPRWRSWDSTVLQPDEFLHRTDGEEMATDEVEFKLNEFRIEPNLGRASDLFSAAILDGNFSAEVQEIAAEISLKSENWPLLNQLATRIVSPKSELTEPEPVPTKDSNRIPMLRSLLALEPRNAIRWVDLAREYLVLGEAAKANRAITLAHALAPTNRFVLRAVATFYWEQEDLEKAIHLLSSSGDFRRDPLILSSLIAVTDLAGKKPQGIRDALKILESGKFHQSNTAELAAAIGTLEFQNGADKKGKKLFRLGLENPTENILAQASWLRNEKRISVTEHLPENVPGAFEANSREFATNLEWQAATAAADNWVNDQAFSTEATTFGSWTSCEALDWEKAIHFSRSGLQTNPHSLILQNNLAYSLIQSGQISEALLVIVQSSKSESESSSSRTALLATEGLLLFRAGEKERARTKYDEAVTKFLAQGNQELALDAAIMIALEEFAEKTEVVDTALGRVEKLRSKVNTERVLNRLEWFTTPELYLRDRIGNPVITAEDQERINLSIK